MAERDAKKVAEGLTDAQREAVAASWDGDYRQSAILTSLVNLGLYKEIGLGSRRKLRHTPLGLAVRDHLRGEQ